MTEMKFNNNREYQQQYQQSSGSGTDNRINNGHSSTSGNSTFKKAQSFMDPLLKLVRIDEKPTKKEVNTLIAIGIIAILFMISITGFFVMWFTEFYNNAIISQLILVENSDAAKRFITPPVGTILKIHVFNYTNIHRYLNGIDKKIKVVDLGPYVYAETNVKVNFLFNGNSTVTFRENRTHKFLEDQSSGKEDDLVIVPNIPALTATAMYYDFNIIEKGGFYAIYLNPTTKPQPIITKTAREFIWGYADTLARLAGLEEFGILMNRKGITADTYQMNTGEHGTSKFGLITQLNGRDKLGHWSTDECNAINGSDGGQFPPHLMNKNQKLEVFLPSLCRKVEIKFDEEVKLFEGVEVWRYRTVDNVFTYSQNTKNLCYCDAKTNKCPISGVLNGPPCYGNKPIYPSFPHFYSGDPILWKDFEGIEPVQELHQTYADIHPRLGFVIGGASRAQINIKIKKNGFYSDQLRRLSDDLILPLVWLEITSDEISEELKTVIFHSTFSANIVQHILKYGTLLISVASFSLMVAGIYFFSRLRDEKELIKADEKANNKILGGHIIEVVKINNEFRIKTDDGDGDADVEEETLNKKTQIE